MIKKLFMILLAVLILMNAVNAVDSSNWTNATVGYETFKIPPQYENPYKSDFNMYEFDKDIDVFTIRFVNHNIMSLFQVKTIQNYGFHQERSSTTSHGMAKR